MLKIVNDIIGKKKKVTNNSAEVKISKLTSEDVKRHMTVIINCRLPDPKYSSQSKNKVTSPKPHVSISETEVKTMEKWDIVGRLYAAHEAKMYNLLKQTNGGRVKHVSLEAGEDANDAGTGE